MTCSQNFILKKEIENKYEKFKQRNSIFFLEKNTKWKEVEGLLSILNHRQSTHISKDPMFFLTNKLGAIVRDFNNDECNVWLGFHPCILVMLSILFAIGYKLI